jgi:hypothetical protein
MARRARWTSWTLRARTSTKVTLALRALALFICSTVIGGVLIAFVVVVVVVVVQR